jgi:hypothetical protein
MGFGPYRIGLGVYRIGGRGHLLTIARGHLAASQRPMSFGGLAAP